MNKSITYLLISALMLLLASLEEVSGQYINVQIDIHAEADADVRQSLDFGTLIANSGVYRIELGHPDMGVFSIRILQAQSMLFNLEVPDYLEHNDPGTEAHIPISLEAAYTNFGEDDYSRAVFMRSPWEEIVMATPDDPNHGWATAYIYLYGQIEVGEIPEGTYRGEIILNIEYE